MNPGLSVDPYFTMKHVFSDSSSRVSTVGIRSCFGIQKTGPANNK